MVRCPIAPPAPPHHSPQARRGAANRPRIRLRLRSSPLMAVIQAVGGVWPPRDPPPARLAAIWGRRGGLTPEALTPAPPAAPYPRH